MIADTLIPPVTNSFVWLWGGIVLSGAVGLRWSRGKMPANANLLDILFLLLWITSVLLRLDRYFCQIAIENVDPTFWMSLAGSLFLATPVFFLRGPWRRLFSISLVIAAVFIVLGDILYFRLHGSIWSFNLWSSFPEFLNSMKSIGHTLGGMSPGLLFGIFIEAVIAGLVAPLPRLEQSPVRGRVLLVSGGIMGFGLAALLGTLFGWGLLQTYRSTRVSSEVQFIRHWGVWNQHLFLLIRDLNEFREREVSFSDRTECLIRVDDYVAGNQSKGQHFGIARQCNLILVQAPALQEYVIGSRVMGQEVTPFLNSLRRDSLEFTRLYSQAVDGLAVDAQSIALTSLHPLTHGAISQRKRLESFVALPDVLRQHQYYTFSAEPVDRWVWDQFNMHQRYGFMESRFNEDLSRLNPEDDEWKGMADEVFMERVAPFVKQLPQPFFAYLNVGLEDRPFPDPIPTILQYLNLSNLEKTSLGKYLEEMREFDYALKLLVDEIEKSNLRDNTVIAVFGDREAKLEREPELQAFLDISKWTSLPPLYQSRVPFFIRVPHSLLHGENTTPGGQVDIAPTLLSLLGIVPPPSFLGRSLLDSPPPVVAFENGSAVSKEFEFSPVVSSIEDPGCFDLQKGMTVEVSNCDGIRSLSRSQVEISDLIHRRDLAVDLQDVDRTREK